ncbi:L,D-transpeptidase family protein [Sulfurovum sp. zt1-1]|uniref:L,D-transpeptidase family protein n=1 Tax=Sulfurovum zhangzhouensis TaxID=3019067 RepID=A0ABT7R011_9BACT|nr:L,D-transpeptidase family protein [Sulfurovum zhangzhouensis]MDM5272426.1 L,D-transpeptidase family protein [Sulfurovum zhangzhouensis]
MQIKLKVLLFASISLLWINGCNKEPVAYGKVDKTPYETKECLRELSCGEEIDKSLLADKIVVYKNKHLMHLYRNGKLVEEFRISLGKNGTKGDKIEKGDYRTPIGNYTIVRKKCDNRLYKSLMISYPNAKDMAEAKKRGVEPGGYITIHGQPKWNADGRGDEYTLAYDWTEGCIAVTNRAMDILWKSIQNGAKIEIYS